MVKVPEAEYRPRKKRPWLPILIAAIVALIVIFAVMQSHKSSSPAAGALETTSLTPEAAKAKDAALQLMTAKVAWHGPEASPKPIAGKRIAVITCCMASEGAVRPAKAIAEAGKAIGWSVDIFDGKGDPQEQNKALNAAVDAHYDGIALLFVDTPTVSDGVARAMTAKIPLITLGALKNTPESIPDVSHDWVGTGKAIANYMIWKSNGKPNVLLIKNTDLYIVSHGQYLGTTQVLDDKSACPDCRSITKEYALANLDTQPASVALAALQGDPSLNWVWCFDSCMSRVSRALIASGIGSQVRGAGFDCNGENVQLIKQGQIQAVCAADPRDWEGYALTDNLNRMMQGQPAIQQNIPIRMFDKDTIGKLSPNEVEHGWQGDFDFRSKYKKLWGVG